MKSKEILEKYIKFYEDRGHKLIPNVSLIPENDPSLLYVNSGMFPLVEYLSGEEHPMGKRLVNVQRCLRFNEDLDNIGETNRHTVAFHMIGNWSLGDYFKKDQLNWAYEFFFDVLGLDPKRTYATVFKGDEDSPRDEEAIEILTDIYSKYGIEAKMGERIFEYGKEDNWWERGQAVGELGGPDSETFYYIGEDGDGFGKNPADNQDEFIEIGNSVFMQYMRTENGWGELPQKNVDFGGGLERLAFVSQGKHDIFETDNFWPLIEKVQELSGKDYEAHNQDTKMMRILADHMRSAVFMAMDGVVPSNKEQGYMLRRLLRRMVRAGRMLGIDREVDISAELTETTVELFSWLYPQLEEKKLEIEKIFKEEEDKFESILDRGVKKVNKYLDSFDGDINDLAAEAFKFYQSIGYPREFFVEDVKDKGMDVDTNELTKRFKELETEHQQQSREGATQKFTGGLADQSEQVVKYHTATHLLHWALRDVLGDTVQQQGSNITGERLRFDFSHHEKLSEEEIQKVQDQINEKVDAGLEVSYKDMPKEDAESCGALHFFNEKYGDTVRVYYIGNDFDNCFSKEFCGGPHVENTKEIGEIEIFKQKSIGKNTIRIYARNKK